MVVGSKVTVKYASSKAGTGLDGISALTVKSPALAPVKVMEVTVNGVDPIFWITKLCEIEPEVTSA